MIIDFHTHIFPDKIAGRTLDYLSDIFGASPFADGTHTGLCDSMKKAGVDVSVSLPAVTKVSQVESINRFASAFTEGAVISFGGIHPECENYKEILKEIKNLGLKGIKLHPDYQDMYFDDIRYETYCRYSIGTWTYHGSPCRSGSEMSKRCTLHAKDGKKASG